MSGPVFILGGAQSDFARNWARDGFSIFDLMQQTTLGALESAAIDPADVQVAHVGNFIGELTCGQGHLGAMVTSIHPRFVGLPSSRHEAACASGSVAALAAAAEIEAGRYDLALVIGTEMMRNVPGDTATQHLGVAAWTGREAEDARYVWPHLFARLAAEYQHRHGLRYEHIARISEINFENGLRNPNAQTRKWTRDKRSFSQDDTANPVIEGAIRRFDCGQVTDGAAVVFLASERFAREHAARLKRPVTDFPIIKGWGHRTDTMRLEDKLRGSDGEPIVLPTVQSTIHDAFRRAGIRDVFTLDGIEVHDCFSITEYMAIDHFGITPPGQSWRAIEEEWISFAGRLPINPSGGLIGLGHPVGATGVRMLLDCFKQVTGTAGSYQVEGARNFATLNIGGSATTVVSFVVGRCE